MLGARRGAIAVLIVLVLVAIGLPVLSGGRGGLAIFASPTAGFLIGWIFAAFVTGYLSERLVNEQQSGLVQTVSFFLTAMVSGIVVLYAFGITYLATVAKLRLPESLHRLDGLHSRRRDQGLRRSPAWPRRHGRLSPAAVARLTHRPALSGEYPNGPFGGRCA